MSQRGWGTYVGLLIALWWGSSTFATSYLRYELDTILQRADIIVFAEVTERSVVLLAETPWTQIRLEPIQVLKGEQTKAAEPILLYGGTSPQGRSVRVEGMPEMPLGAQLLIMRYDARYASPLVGFSQGLWTLGARGFVDNQGRILAVNAAGELGFLADFQARDELPDAPELETPASAVPAPDSSPTPDSSPAPDSSASEEPAETTSEEVAEEDITEAASEELAEASNLAENPDSEVADPSSTPLNATTQETDELEPPTEATRSEPAAAIQVDTEAVLAALARRLEKLASTAP